MCQQSWQVCGALRAQAPCVPPRRSWTRLWWVNGTAGDSATNSGARCIPWLCAASGNPWFPPGVSGSFEGRSCGIATGVSHGRSCAGAPTCFCTAAHACRGCEAFLGIPQQGVVMCELGPPPPPSLEYLCKSLALELPWSASGSRLRLPLFLGRPVVILQPQLSRNERHCPLQVKILLRASRQATCYTNLVHAPCPIEPGPD